MGAFKTLLDSIRATITGLIPLGGTLNPTSEDVPIAMAQNIKGNSFAVPTLEALADIPYPLLQLDMEVVVSEHVRPISGTLHERTTYFLKALPAGTRVSEITNYVITDYWEAIEGGFGEPGAPGSNGWSPQWALETDGPSRVVERFIDWIGGTGTKPTSPVSPKIYRGPLTAGSYFVIKSQAINLKGNEGPAGSSAQARPEAYFSIGSKTTTAATILDSSGTNNRDGSDPLQITNVWTSPRKFRIECELPWRNGNGAVELVTYLRYSSQLFMVSGGAVLDSTFGRDDWILESNMKIYTRGVLTLNAGETVYVKLMFKKIGGNHFYYEKALLEAWGL